MKIKAGDVFSNVCDVYLDDTKQKLCTLVDEDKKFIERLVVDLNNKPVVENDEFVIERVYGEVKIVVDEEYLDAFNKVYATS